MLSLQSTTPPAFVERFAANAQAMILDHAHCEKKASSTALNMLFRYPEKTELVEVLADIVEEEIQHFKLVLGLMKRRGWAYEKQVPSQYAGKLMVHCATREPDALLDRLIVCALIEARSCERFQLLGQGLEDAELAALFRGLFDSEARHYATYLKLALAYFPEPRVRERLAFLSERESEIITEGDPNPRLHG